jgi:histidyl-tRNA synthetase
MGYYTGPIFEVAHPSLGYSLGGGGRYDGMIGRFLGTDVPATGFSLGFERLVDLVELPADATSTSIALVYDADASAITLAVLKSQLIAEGTRVRLVKRIKNVKLLFDALAAEGFTHFAFVNAATGSVDDLERRPLGA